MWHKKVRVHIKPGLYPFLLTNIQATIKKNFKSLLRKLNQFFLLIPMNRLYEEVLQ